MTDDHLPIRLLHDRVLVDLDVEGGERRSSAGIVIPATARMGKRLAWATVTAVGANVRMRGRDYVLLRERDVHAVAAERLGDGGTGLYL